MTVTHYTHAQTAKLVRAALKTAFPPIKFFVTSRPRSVKVCWVDGPSGESVCDVVEPFSWKRYDGRIASEYTIDAWIKNGRIVGHRCVGAISSRGRVDPYGLEAPELGCELVNFGTWVSISHIMSATQARKAAAQVSAYFSVPMPIIEEVDNWRPGMRAWRIDDKHDTKANGRLPDYWSEMIYRAANDETRYASDRLPIAAID
jgi:hypothetical protein